MISCYYIIVIFALIIISLLFYIRYLLIKIKKSDNMTKDISLFPSQNLDLKNIVDIL